MMMHYVTHKIIHSELQVAHKWHRALESIIYGCYAYKNGEKYMKPVCIENEFERQDSNWEKEANELRIKYMKEHKLIDDQKHVLNDENLTITNRPDEELEESEGLVDFDYVFLADK
jgi:hypothetical protein